MKIFNSPEIGQNDSNVVKYHSTSTWSGMNEQLMVGYLQPSDFQSLCSPENDTCTEISSRLDDNTRAPQASIELKDQDFKNIGSVYVQAGNDVDLYMTVYADTHPCTSLLGSLVAKKTIQEYDCHGTSAQKIWLVATNSYAYMEVRRVSIFQ